MTLHEVDAAATTTAEQDRAAAASRELLAKLQAVAPPTTTRAEDQKAEGQRGINVIWERTQQIIALSAVTVGLGVSGFEVLTGGPRAEASLNLITAIVSSVTGFYLSRTNHVKSSGGPTSGTRD